MPTYDLKIVAQEAFSKFFWYDVVPIVVPIIALLFVAFSFFFFLRQRRIKRKGGL